MTQLSQELQERALGLIEVFAHGRHTSDTFREARALWAESNPVDPDLIEARKMAAREIPSRAKAIMAGEWDQMPAVRLPFLGIKLGRELAKAGS